MKRLKKFGVIMFATMFSLTMGTSLALASEAPSPTSPTAGLQTIVDSISSSFSLAEIAGIIAIGITACSGLVLFWFGVRKLVRAVMTAFQKGKLSV